MPLGMMTLAAVLLQQKIPVKIYEPKVRLLQSDDYVQAAKNVLALKPSIIGFSTWCTSFPGIILLAREIKRISPGVIIIFGGPQASILPKETLQQFSFIDYILTGEADHTFPQLINELQKKTPDLSEIGGLCYRQKSVHEIRLNSKIGIDFKLDELPLPAYHLIPKQKVIKLDVGRGCPFHCTYCTTGSFFSKKFRMKSVDRIIGEMFNLNEEYGVRDFEFTHDMLTLQRNEVMSLCNKLIERQHKKNIRFTWKCSARIDFVDEEMLGKMAKAGCTSIFFGIESGSEKIQRKIRKNLSVPKAAKVADACRKTGIDMHASYIVGFPEETKPDINKTLNNVLQLLLKGALVQCSVLALLPGTPLFEQHHPNLKFDGNFSNFSQTICSNEELKLIKNNLGLFSSFYYLPVKTMSHSSMVFMGSLINKLPQFRNTFFVLRKQLTQTMNGKNLLSLFLSVFKNVDKQDKESPIELQIANFLKPFISKFKQENADPYIEDIFKYEVYSALLKKLFMTWQLLDQKHDLPTISDRSQIEINPTWKLIQTNYKLERILPTENNWNVDVNNVRIGTYNYLLVATSEISCKRINVSGKERQLFEQLGNCSVQEFIARSKTFADNSFVNRWLKKLHRLGVIRISNS